MTDRPAKNTDRELYREPKGDLPSDYYAPSVHVTADGRIGMNVGGTVLTMTIREWVERASMPTGPDRVVKRAEEFRQSRAPWAHRFMAVDDSDECGICGMSRDEENHHDLSLIAPEDQ